jgi:hypothetical protein
VATTSGYDSGYGYGPAHLDGIGLQLATVQPLDAPLPSRHRRHTAGSAGLGSPGTNGSTGDAAPTQADVGGGAAFLGRLFGRGASREESNVFITVEAVSRLEDAELSPDDLARVSTQVGTVVIVLVGGEVPRFERLARNEIAVFLPVGRAMHDIWNLALDLPIGEERAVDATEEELAHPTRARLEAM